MAHRINVQDVENMKGLLTKESIRDFINLFFRWEDSTFNVLCFADIDQMRTRFADPKLSRTLRGEHRYNTMEKTHTISLVHSNIMDAWRKRKAAGGNIAPPAKETVAAMVLAHELQHANQVKYHKPVASNSFYSRHAYKDKACEREARQFVDEHIDEICAYYSVPPPKRRRKERDDVADEIEEIVDLLKECEQVTLDDVREELRSSKILNPKNVATVLSLLREEGTPIRS